MSNYRLPDFADKASPRIHVSEDENRDGAWTERHLNEWLAAPALADWVPIWFENLREQFGEVLPDLVRQGLESDAGIPDWMKTGAPDAVWLRRFLDIADAPRIWFEKGFLADDPAWLSRLLHYEQAGVARSFLLTGNISDYAFDPVCGYRHAVRLLVDVLKRKKDCVLTYRLSRGLAAHSSDPDILKRLPNAIVSEIEAEGYRHDLPLMTEVCRLFDILGQWLAGENGGGEFEKGVAIIFENVHLLMPPNTGDIERNYLIDSLLHWSNSPELFRSSHCLILMAETLEDVSGELRARGGKIEQIGIPRPDDAKSRFKFIYPLLDPRSSMRETRSSGLTSGLSGLDGYSGDYLDRLGQLGHDTAGLNFLGIEDLLQEAVADPDRRLSRETVMLLKRERLRQESRGMIELLDPRITLDDIGGYGRLKDRLREVVAALRNFGDPVVRSTVPMGILLLGPPGTGKSIIAEALAGESAINMARLGDFRGMYVGQSERNLSLIFSLIESLHPVIVFVDEIDQALGKRGADSRDGGVDNRIFGRFLEFMSDTEHRGKILWIGASNFPDRIDPAFKRAGRFDLILPVLLPDEAGRKSILQITLRRELSEAVRVKTDLAERDFERLAAMTEGYSGAELRAVVGEVIRRSVSKRIEKPGDDKWRIAFDVFDEVLRDYKPSPVQRKNYRRMEALAVEDIGFVDLLPEKYRQAREQFNE